MIKLGMRKLEIGDAVEVIKMNYPRYRDYGLVVGFHNGNVLVHFYDNPYKAAETKEYPENSLKLVPSNWIHRDTSSEPMNVGESLIKRVIFSGNKTIILWNDGAWSGYKTMVSCAEGEQLDPYMGFCAAFTKGFFGSKHQVEKMVKNAEYQPSKKTKKKISEVLKQLREDDTKNEELPEFLKKKLITNNTEASESLIGKKVKNTKLGSAYENFTGEITHKDDSGTLIATIKISDGTIELPFKPCDFTFIDNE